VSNRWRVPARTLAKRLRRPERHWTRRPVLHRRRWV